MDYKDFIKSKFTKKQDSGFEVIKTELNPMLFDFQKDVVKLSLKRGKFAVFANTGMGKTLIQLEWSKQVTKKENKPVIILAPLAVSKQTVNEGAKFGYDVKLLNSGQESKDKIYITNYEQLHNFDLNDYVGVVLDESSILKSFSGKIRNQIIDQSQKIKYKLACTATPSPNDYMELGNHSEFLNIKTRTEMLSTFFIHDSGNTQKWRLKGHVDKIFWQWVSTWALMFRSPSDLGYEMNEYDLPKLNIIEHIVKTEVDFTDLFGINKKSLNERRKARRESIDQRFEQVKNIVESDPKGWLVWCDYNNESEMIAKGLNFVEIAGKHKNDYKAEKMLEFAVNNDMNVVTKSKLAGFGMNWQNHNKMIFFGLSDSYEMFYQSIRRMYRFGQKKQVDVHIIISDKETEVLDNIKRKDKDMNKMTEKMIENIFKNSNDNYSDFYESSTHEGQGYKLINGDSAEEIKKIKDNSIDYMVYSPPFAELYTYSDSLRDMGNSSSYDEFFEHFEFLAKELNRVLKNGRLMSVHCIDIPAMKERDGFIGLKDFPGQLRQLFEKVGFIYHSRVTIWKNPLVEATRTKALGLMHKQLCKDSAISRQGLPDYILTFRKKGKNEEPISRDHFTKENWHGENEPVQTGIKYSHEVWRRYASPVWMDINQSDTLNFREARSEKDEKHLCPLQLPVISRCLELWTNKGDVVFTPFAGVGSELYQALLMGRKAIGIELKKEYYQQAIKNCESAIEKGKQITLEF